MVIAMSSVSSCAAEEHISPPNDMLPCEENIMNGGPGKY